MRHADTLDRHVPADPTNGNDPSINGLMAALVAELEAEDIPAPLHQSLTLGAVWTDLCRLAGEDPPAAVRALLDEPVVR